MSRTSRPSHWTHLFFRYSHYALFLGFTTTVLGTIGCGESKSKQEQDSKVTEDPVGEFKWGMERLDRYLKLNRPRGADGVSVTEREMKYDIFPPDDTNPQYTARVTVTSEIAFLHAKREPPKKEKKTAEKEAFEIDDPIGDKSEKDLAKYIDIPGAGPQAPTAAAPAIDTVKVDNKSVFDLVYTEGKWQLTTQPEHRYEEMWFEYAFN